MARGLAPYDVPSLSQHFAPDRFSVCRWGGATKPDIAFSSVYLVADEEDNHVNMGWLDKIGKRRCAELEIRTYLVVTGRCRRKSLQILAWVDSIAGVIVAPAKPTYVSAVAEVIIDYLVVHRCPADMVTA